jgi:hypothetical protein
MKFSTTNNSFKKSHLNITPSVKLINRITTTLSDIKKYIEISEQNP